MESLPALSLPCICCSQGYFRLYSVPLLYWYWNGGSPVAVARTDEILHLLITYWLNRPNNVSGEINAGNGTENHFNQPRCCFACINFYQLIWTASPWDILKNQPYYPSYIQIMAHLFSKQQRLLGSWLFTPMDSQIHADLHMKITRRMVMTLTCIWALHKVPASWRTKSSEATLSGSSRVFSLQTRSSCRQNSRTDQKASQSLKPRMTKLQLVKLRTRDTGNEAPGSCFHGRAAEVPDFIGRKRKFLGWVGKRIFCPQEEQHSRKRSAEPGLHDQDPFQPSFLRIDFEQSPIHVQGTYGGDEQDVLENHQGHKNNMDPLQHDHSWILPATRQRLCSSWWW